MMNKPYVIAEIGVNFYDTSKRENISLMEAAKKYIWEAKHSGVDAVKFQSYKADTIVSKKSPAYWDTRQEPTATQYELFQKHDKFDQGDYCKLYEYSKSLGIDFMSTPFDYHSADYLEDMVDIYKISSSDISNLPFLEYIARKGKPIYLSTGASYLSEIEEAVRTILNNGCPEMCLLHCVLSYPCKNEDANLARIKTLKQIFPNLKIGYSDHTLPDETMTILTTAYLCGADVIEKHFTLDKNMAGNDHYHAGDPKDFKKAINNFKVVQSVMGDAGINVLPCEEVARREARRSLIINKNKKAGEIINPEDVIAKRPGYGIPPRFFDKVVGRQLKIDIEEDTVLTWDLI